MAGDADRQSITLDDSERNRLHGTWSRSGKNLILTIMDSKRSPTMQQIELRPEQVETLVTFLSDTLARRPTDR
jgi:hypothetical protein